MPVIKGQTVAPTVDLDVLKNRLRMTDAIGFFNKISLNRRIENLIENFRRFHHADGTVSLASLTGQFSTLIDETLALVQEGDQDLHATIKDAKGGLWRLFSNRIEFAKAFGSRNVAMVPDKIEGD